jgi:predicted heme/steroid binding protein
MGYRTYIAPMPRSEYEMMKDFTKDELLKYKNAEEDGYVGVYNITQKAIYEFGKYTEFDDSKFFKPFFTNKDLQDDFTSEQDFWVVEKDYLRHIIEFYKKLVQDFYTELLSGITHNNSAQIYSVKSQELYNHVRSNATEWLQLSPFDLDKGDAVTTSWKYEYSIFELVRIYKSFDWENNVMVYYGY